MGCNCGNRVNREKLDKLITKNKEMAKKKYRVVKGTSEDARLVLRGMKIYVRDLDQNIMKALYEAGHPSIELDEDSGKKDK